MKLIFFLLFVEVVFVSSAKVSYRNFKTYSLIPKTQKQLRVLKSLENDKNIDYWAPVTRVNNPAVIMVGPKYLNKFESTLTNNNISFKITMDDVEEIFEKERNEIESLPRLNKGEVAFDRYLRYSEIQDYLLRLEGDYSDLVTVSTYGYSYEKRRLTYIKISSGDTYGGKDQRKIIFVDAGMHGREWYSICQALYIIHQLIENSHNKKLIQNVDWVIVPLVNPDGYEYSYEVDRTWRKTRSKGKVCDGVDPNRNFNYRWREKGASKNECSASYSGPKPFSEPETLALSELMLKYAEKTILYLSFHAGYQAVLYPYENSTVFENVYHELLWLGHKVVETISTFHKTEFRVGTFAEVYDYISGDSCSWAYGVAKIRLPYLIALPPYPEQINQMCPNTILGVVSEMFDGVVVFHEYVDKRYRKQK